MVIPAHRPEAAALTPGHCPFFYVLRLRSHSPPDPMTRATMAPPPPEVRRAYAAIVDQLETLCEAGERPSHVLVAPSVRTAMLAYCLQGADPADDGDVLGVVTSYWWPRAFTLGSIIAITPCPDCWVHVVAWRPGQTVP